MLNNDETAVDNSIVVIIWPPEVDSDALMVENGDDGSVLLSSVVSVIVLVINASDVVSSLIVVSWSVENS